MTEYEVVNACETYVLKHIKTHIPLKKTPQNLAEALRFAEALLMTIVLPSHILSILNT